MKDLSAKQMTTRELVETAIAQSKGKGKRPQSRMIPIGKEKTMSEFQ